VRNIHFEGVTVNGAARSIIFEGLPERPIESLSLRNVSVAASSNGVVCSQVHGLTLENLEVTSDQGPRLEVSDVRDLDVTRFRSAKPDALQPAIRLTRIEGAFLQGCATAAGSKALVEVNGPGSAEIALALSRVPKGSKEVEFAGGASPDALVK
jgi:hypothetical protein